MVVNLKELSYKTPFLTHQHSKEPTWASDTGRNSNSGKFGGTFIGYFSQLVLEFGESTQEEMTEIKKNLEHPIVEVTFLNSDDGKWRTEEFYGTGIPAKKDNWEGDYKSFSLTLTAVNEFDDI